MPSRSGRSPLLLAALTLLLTLPACGAVQIQSKAEVPGRKMGRLVFVVKPGAIDVPLEEAVKSRLTAALRKHGVEARAANLIVSPGGDPVKVLEGQVASFGAQSVLFLLPVRKEKAKEEDIGSAIRYDAKLLEVPSGRPVWTASIEWTRRMGGADPFVEKLVTALVADGMVPSGSAEPYGPLTVNLERGADFYVVQDGAFAPATVTPEAITIRLKNRPFQIGTGSHQVNLCLTLAEVPEVRADPAGNRASCLSGPFQSAKEPNSATLYVFPGKSWSDGNNLLQDGEHRAAPPREGYARAFQVDDLLFIDSPGTAFARFRGTVFGYIVVYRESVRRNRDIMPIRLVFEGP